MKTCPYCAESIQDAAVVCRFCQRPYKSGITGESDRSTRALVVLLVVVALAIGGIVAVLLLYAFILAPMFGLPRIGAL